MRAVPRAHRVSRVRHLQPDRPRRLGRLFGARAATDPPTAPSLRHYLTSPPGLHHRVCRRRRTRLDSGPSGSTGAGTAGAGRLLLTRPNRSSVPLLLLVTGPKRTGSTTGTEAHPGRGESEVDCAGSGEVIRGSPNRTPPRTAAATAGPHHGRRPGAGSKATLEAASCGATRLPILARPRIASRAPRTDSSSARQPSQPRKCARTARLVAGSSSSSRWADSKTPGCGSPGPPEGPPGSFTRAPREATGGPGAPWSGRCRGALPGPGRSARTPGRPRRRGRWPPGTPPGAR